MVVKRPQRRLKQALQFYVRLEFNLSPREFEPNNVGQITRARRWRHAIDKVVDRGNGLPRGLRQLHGGQGRVLDVHDRNPRFGSTQMV